MIQGTSSGSGKSTIVAALCRIFSDKGYKVAPFKSQNMSNFAYSKDGFEISQAQAIQALAARCDITPYLNPILLKPLGNYTSLVVIEGKHFKKMTAKDYYQNFATKKGLTIAKKSLEKLQKVYDLVILEGAGSPAEINLTRYDIANMKIAKAANSPVLLVSDIERGGAFASIVGTLELLDEKYNELVRGFIINKFRGDIEILKPSFRKIKQRTNKPVLGTIPLLSINLPEEDSLGKKPKPWSWNKKNYKMVDKELDLLSKTIESHLNIKKIEEMIT